MQYFWQRGDVIDIISMNASGVWRGHLNGEVGHFKFISVEVMLKNQDNGAVVKRQRRKSTCSRYIHKFLLLYISELMMPCISSFLMHKRGVLQVFEIQWQYRRSSYDFLHFRRWFDSGRRRVFRNMWQHQWGRIKHWQGHIEFTSIKTITASVCCRGVNKNRPGGNENRRIIWFLVSKW